MVTSLQDVPVTVPRSVVEVPQRTLSRTFKSRDWSPVIGSFCRSQTPHREFDLPVWQLSPMLHNGHVTALRKLTKNLASLEASRFYGNLNVSRKNVPSGSRCSDMRLAISLGRLAIAIA